MKRFIFGTLSLLLVSSATPVALASEFVLEPEADRQELQLAQTPSMLLARGSFVTVEQDHPTQGTARIVEENGQRYLVFDRAFTTAQGPDVEVILYRGSQVPVNIAERDYITLAPLQSFDGEQRYAIPANLDLGEFGAVGIWCRQFNVTFGYAAL